MLSVSIPKIRGQRVRAAEVRPRRVEEWLDTLPRADAKECGQQLYQALYAQNRIALEAKNRLVLMELYRQPVASVVDSLQQVYRLASFPLSERERQQVDFVHKLLAELSNGYKIVANDLLRGGNKKSHHSELTTAIQRALHFLGAALVNAFQAYIACPPGLWREIHQLYRYAETNELLNYPVPAEDTITQDGLTTISETYQRILVVGAASPYGLLQGECVRLYESIPLWESQAEIDRIPPLAETTGRFVVNLESDSPPIALDKTPMAMADEKLRFINVIAVARDIHRLLKGLEKASARRAIKNVIPGVNPAYTDMLRRVGRVLAGLNTRRQSHRSPKEGGVPICHGVNAIHFFASGEQVFIPTADSVTSQRPEDDADSAEDVGRHGTLNGSEALGPSSLWREGGSEFPLHACKTKDESANGVRLYVTEGSDLRVRVGDAIGLQHPTPERWRAGVVRWIRSPSDEVLEMGIQLLGPDLLPVTVKPVSKESSEEYARGLLVPANRALKQPESLLLARGIYDSGDKLLIGNAEGDPTVVSPVGILDRTGSFDQLMLAPAQFH